MLPTSGEESSWLTLPYAKPACVHTFSDVDHLKELPANAQTIKTRSWLGLATSKWMFHRYELCHLGGDLWIHLQLAPQAECHSRWKHPFHRHRAEPLWSANMVSRTQQPRGQSSTTTQVTLGIAMFPTHGFMIALFQRGPRRLLRHYR